jgi:hypothetical protein
VEPDAIRQPDTARRPTFFSSLWVPFVCTVMSVCVNIILAQAEILDRAALAGNPPTVLDVSIQLVFISVGAIASIGLVEDDGLRARALRPLLYCFAALCIILAMQALSKQHWGWVVSGMLRVWIPDVIGAMTMGLTIWDVEYKWRGKNSVRNSP